MGTPGGPVAFVTPRRVWRRLEFHFVKMADTEMTPEQMMEAKKKRQFRKFTFRGVDLDKLLDLSNEEFMELVHALARRRMTRGLKRKPMELPKGIKTRLRDMLIVPEMIGSVVGIYNG